MHRAMIVLLEILPRIPTLRQVQSRILPMPCTKEIFQKTTEYIYD